MKVMLKSSVLILVFALSMSLGLKKGLAFDDNDFQWWRTADITWKINENWKWKAEMESYFGDDAGDFYYHHFDFGATYSGWAKWFDLGINYRQVFEEKSFGWRNEYRPHLNGTVKFDIKDFNVSDRVRVELRFIDDLDESVRIRNCFKVKAPWKFTKRQIQPYVADEIFVDCDQGELNRNRIYAGVEYNIVENLKGELYYLLQASKSGDDWTDAHILGTKFKLSF